MGALTSPNTIKGFSLKRSSLVVPGEPRSGEGRESRCRNLAHLHYLGSLPAASLMRCGAGNDNDVYCFTALAAGDDNQGA